MPLTKSKGNMYDWVTHTHSHLAGACPHKCEYCYVQKNRFGVPKRYTGPVRLIEAELTVKYGSGKTIFIEHMGDLFADGIRQEYIFEILKHCNQWPDNTYVFQTKNPYLMWLYSHLLPPKCILGTTIETNREIYNSEAPSTANRATYIHVLKILNYKTFITIEPIMNFDLENFSQMIIFSRPSFINIGADSKNCELIEPSKEKLIDFIATLNASDIEIRQKSNLARLLK